MSNLAKIIDNQIVYSNSCKNLVLNNRRIFNPTEAEFRQAGFTDLPQIEHEEGQTVVYYIKDGQITPKVINFNQYNTYSKLKLIENIEKEGVNWAEVEAWLNQNGLLPKWYAAQELRSDYEGFDNLVELAKVKFPNADIDHILENSKI